MTVIDQLKSTISEGWYSGRQSTFSLRIGTIQLWNPIRKLYQVSVDGLEEREVYSAVDINAIARDSYGVTNTHNYRCGDRVFLAVPVYDTVRWFIILGLAGGTELTTSDASTAIPQSTLNGLFTSPVTQNNGQAGTAYYEDLIKAVEDRTQAGYQAIVDESGEPIELTFRGSAPVDNYPGSHSFIGKHTNLTVADHIIKLMAGSAIDVWDSLFGLHVSAALIHKRYSSTEDEGTKLFGNWAEQYKKSALDVRTAQGMLEADKQCIYTAAELFSPYVYGKSNILYDTEGRPVSAVTQRLDGVTEIKGVNGISFEKTVDILSAELTDSAAFQQLKVDISACKTYNEIVTLIRAASKDDLTVPKSLTAGSDILPGPTVGEGVAKSADTDFFNDGLLTRGIEYTKAKSCIRMLPGGGIVLRDAWGSELRLEGGNIQLSAANNLTAIAGRDMMDIVQGVRVIAASEEVQIGAARRNIILNAENSVKIKSVKDTVLVSDNMLVETTKETRVSGAGFIAKGNQYAVLASEEGGAIVTGRQAQVVGESNAIIATEKGAFTIQNNSIVAGCPGGMTILGRTGIREGTLTVNGVLNKKADKELEVKCKASKPGLEVAGSFLSDFIHANTGVVCSGQIIGSVIAGKNNAEGKVQGVSGSLKKQKMDKGDDNCRMQASSVVESQKKWTRQTMETLKKVFTIASAAYHIWQPKFSKLLGKGRISVPVEKDPQQAYIYPGNDFWNKTGSMSEWQEDVMDLAESGKDIKASAGSLNLGAANIKEI